MGRSVLLVWIAATALAGAMTFQEDFSHDPLTRGWRVFGPTNLFQWDATNQNLAVTWDSAQSNAYFQLPLGNILGRDDDFSLGLDLRIDDAVAGIYPGKPSTFELAFGLQNMEQAEQTNFFRGSGGNSPNVVEFDFFPDTGFGATIWPAIWSTNSVLNYNGSIDYTVMDLPTGVWLRISLDYFASNATLVTSVLTNGISVGPIHPLPLSGNFTDFRVTAFAFASYTDAAQSGVPGSLLAHGVVDNVKITTPPAPIQDLRGSFTNGTWVVQFLSRSSWVYVLQQTPDFASWINATTSVWGTGATLTLQDTNPMAAERFYRVRAEKP